ncbi:MAG: sensor histidine kinase [Burkholderiaceae bacterium]
MAIDAVVTHKSSRETASVVQDRLLLGSARMIAEQISFEDGAFQHQIPPAALELFQSQEQDRIFYRVTTASGLLLAGYTDLPLPTTSSGATVPFFFDADMKNERVRVVVFYQPVIGNPSALPVVVEVAQTQHEQRKLTQQLWWKAMAQQLGILALTTLLILYGLRRGLQPLLRLRDDVRSRQEGSGNALLTRRVPSELAPLVDAFNEYIQRMESFTRQRAVYIQNAAHQLRTPLAVLNTQISDAARARSKAAADQSLHDARKTLQQTTRMVNQFLTVSAAESYEPSRIAMTTQQCCELLQEVLEELALAAHTKGLDLGFERSGVDTVIASDPHAMREIATNVIDNAVRYTPPGGKVTTRLVSSAGVIELEIEDNGPGIPVAMHERVFERFFRLDGAESDGSGLGLAIVKELAAQCGAAIAVRPADGRATGLHFSIRFRSAEVEPGRAPPHSKGLRQNG